MRAAVNRFLLAGVLAMPAIAAAQDSVRQDTLTLETMMHKLPEVMVKGARPVARAERGMLTYNMPLLLRQLPADNAYEAAS